jgi:hypothetical protein
MVQEEDKRRREIERIRLFDAEENYVRAVLKTRHHDTTSYGIMSYHEWIVQDRCLSEYNIIYTTTDLQDILAYITNYLQDVIRAKTYTRMLFYAVSGIEPQLVSYNYIVNSQFQWLKITPKRVGKLCSFQGDKNLYEILIKELYYVKEYNRYMNSIGEMSKKELEELHFEIYGNWGWHTKEGYRNKLLKYARKHI